MAGESAGGISVASLLAIPAASGLFHRAICQSGGAQHCTTRTQAARLSAHFAAVLGVPGTRDAFLKVSAERLVAAQMRVTPGSVDLADSDTRDPTGDLTVFLPVQDGELLTGPPVDAMAAGASADVALLVGTNRDEMNLYYVPHGLCQSLETDRLHEMIARWHPDPERLIRAYRARRPRARPGDVYSAVMTDWYFRIPTVHMAERRARGPAATWVYEFTWPSPAFRRALGACHALELPFVFDTLDAPYLTGPEGLLGTTDTVEDNRLSELATRTHAAWVAFARRGDPGWPPYSSERRIVMQIGESWDVDIDPGGEERRAWAGVR